MQDCDFVDINFDEINREINIEVIKEKSSTLKLEVIKQHVILYLQEIGTSHAPISFTKDHFEKDSCIDKNVVKISVIYCEDGMENGTVNFNRNPLRIHLYELNERDEVYEEEIEHDDERVSAAENSALPLRGFDELWDSLVFDRGIKSDLLNYAYSALLFSDQKVCQSLVSWNKIILLHGPPGTGKTSLCRALANKLSIRLSHRYTRAHLIEVNSHSLFSKWFSESGKLVAKMMQTILDYVDNGSGESSSTLVFVLIDEIESLTAMRQSSLAGNEPSDAIRVVNSLLTQLDKIKNYPNVFLLTTSNITEAIDAAFLDRTDIRIFVDNPSTVVCYHVLRSCLQELMLRKIIVPSQQLISHRALNFMQYADTKVSKLSLLLWSVCQKCEGFSGRTIRKLTFLAHSKYIRRSQCNIEEFLMSLAKQVNDINANKLK